MPITPGQQRHQARRDLVTAIVLPPEDSSRTSSELLDRGRPARKRAEGAQPSQMAWHRFSRFALIAGETPAGPGKSLDANQDLVILRV